MSEQKAARIQRARGTRPPRRTPAVNFNQRPTVARTAPLVFFSLFGGFVLLRDWQRVHYAFVFLPLSLYLAVNGCRGTNEAASNSCTSSGRRGWHWGAKHPRFVPGEQIDNPFAFSAHTHELAVTDSPQRVFFFSPALAEAISQPRSSLAFYISTYMERRENAASHYLAAQLLRGSNSWPFLSFNSWSMRRSPATRLPSSLLHSFVSLTHTHTPSLWFRPPRVVCLIHFAASASKTPAPLSSFPFSLLSDRLKSKSDTVRVCVCVCVWRGRLG